MKRYISTDFSATWSRRHETGPKEPREGGLVNQMGPMIKPRRRQVLPRGAKRGTQAGLRGPTSWNEGVRRGPNVPHVRFSYMRYLVLFILLGARKCSWGTVMGAVGGPRLPRRVLGDPLGGPGSSSGGPLGSLGAALGVRGAPSESTLDKQAALNNYWFWCTN